MGRPPNSGGSVFRFTPAEVADMEAYLQEVNNAIPSREATIALADKFSASPERLGKTTIQFKQVWNWFQNRRYSQRAKMSKNQQKINVSPTKKENSIPCRNATNSLSAGPGRDMSDNSKMEFEAKSARDGAWYDVVKFLSHRKSDTDYPEALLRYDGYGSEEDEWVSIVQNLRLRSFPCEETECVLLLPGDPVLCFQVDKDHSLYFDAHIIDVQRRRHDFRGCRCRFLVQYDHDKSQEIIPLQKICRRPETNVRVSQANDTRSVSNDASMPEDQTNTLQKRKKLKTVMELNKDEVPISVPSAVELTSPEKATKSDANLDGAAVEASGSGNSQE
ncbi:Sequence-specific DNA binding transcription factor [Zostera marina]|uniref:Sequence-specific DNA binding transcription factor n=1 Tax=Zostera marina TaxID=29655 RepID=A0A0K9NL67_ZOSMR|nr:Sequence-specific DNA binding transcription factor [Zostera marina]